MDAGDISSTTQSGAVDVRYYASLLWRGRYIIATGGAVGLALGLLAAFLQVPVYQATATLQIDPPTPTFMTVTDALVGGGNYWQNSDFYNTQYRILHSTMLGDRVVESLGMKDSPPFKGVADPGGLFMSHVAVDPIPETRLVQVSVFDGNPQTAALWANALATVYVKETLSNRVQAAMLASQWLQEQLTATQKSMRDSQERFFKAMEGQNLFVPEGSVSAVTTSITKLNEDFIQTQGRRIELEAALKQVADMRTRGERLDAIPQVAKDAQVAALDTQFTSLNVELSRLKEKYKEAHPEVQRVQAQIAEIQKVRTARATQIVAGLEAEYRQLQQKETELRAAIDRQKEQASSQSRKVTELEALKKEAESTKGLYDVLLQKLNETNIAASIRNNNVTVVERALPATSPVRPRKERIAAIGGLLGLALGIGLLVGRDYLEIGRAHV
jgi:succinoglycan biosynthesis transport protein ExoP